MKQRQASAGLTTRSSKPPTRRPWGFISLAFGIVGTSMLATPAATRRCYPHQGVRIQADGRTWHRDVLNRAGTRCEADAIASPL